MIADKQELGTIAKLDQVTWTKWS